MDEFELILDSVKKMKAAGETNDKIRQTLRDVGLSDPEIDNIFKELGEDVNPVPEIKKEEIKAPEIKEIKEEPKIKEIVEEEPIIEQKSEVMERMDEIETKVNNINVATDAIKFSMAEIDEKIENMIENQRTLVNKIQFEKNGNSDKKLAELKRRQDDMQAMLNAMQSLMKKMIETNREILRKL